ncbi:leucyl aminopeptidase [Aliidiomarina sp. Khilg15.8]
MKLVRSLVLGVTMALSGPVLADSYLQTSFAFTQQAQADQADTLVVLVPGGTEQFNLRGWNTSTRDQVARAVKAAEFDGSKSSLVEVLAPAGLAADRILLLGMGDLSETTRSEAEKAGAALAAHVNKTNASDVLVNTELLNAAANPSLLIASVAHGIDLRNYRFDKYKSEPDARPSQSYTFSASGQAEGEYNRLAALAEGVFIARELTNEPGSGAYPAKFIEQAMSLRDDGIEITVLDPQQVKDMGMGALYGVGKGSPNGPHLLVMQWKGSDDAPIALVGKGNTFDTGGYNIKTSSGSMRRMHTDLAGGAAVVGALKALAGQQAPVNVVGIVPLTQNLISGDAQLPGDVVTTGSGKTIEVANTDAEGRLILADALWYARSQFNPRVMVDIATLTGAKVGAVGTTYSAVFSEDEHLVQQLTAAGETVDERLWRLPIDDEFRSAIDSRIADIKNTGSPGASAGAMLLREFVGDTPWAHIDMAGNALIDSDKGIHPRGGTGYGVRLLTEWVYQYSGE